MSNEQPPRLFINHNLHDRHWAKHDEVIRKPWSEVDAMFSRITRYGSARMNPTVILSALTNVGDRQTLDELLVKLNTLSEAVKKVRDSIPVPVEYTPEYYKDHFYSSLPQFGFGGESFNGFNARDKMPADYPHKQSLLDGAWLCKVCVGVDLSETKCANGTFLAHIKKMAQTFDFTGYVGPTVEEPDRFRKMLDVASSAHALWIRCERMHKPAQTAGHAKKQSLVTKMIHDQ
jgi:hypothetical protein